MSGNENLLKLKHLYCRAGFGLHFSELQQLSGTIIKKQVQTMINEAKKDLPISSIAADEVRAVMLNKSGISKKSQLQPNDRIQRRQVLEALKRKMKNLNTEWIQRMITTDSPLREKMTLFWSGHFACRAENDPFFAQELNNIQRANALGNFKTMLVKVSQSAAMLNFLNNQQNRKAKPNENFARELMELFTLGRGNYTEQDIKQSARAFTGWAHDESGNFRFNDRTHDDGIKIFFGKTGNFGGEDIIDMILDRPETATFIARKMYRFFVNDEPNESHVKELSDQFYKSNYDISELVFGMFTADWFYTPENTGNKIKSPVEFIVGLSRQFFITYHKPDILLQLQRGLGQALFYPPNVAGWAGGKNWIDSSSLMLRLVLPSQLLKTGTTNFTAKTDPDDENVVALKNNGNREMNTEGEKGNMRAEANWENFWSNFPEQFTIREIASFLLQSPISTQLHSLFSESSNKKAAIIKVVSTPEFQLC